MKAELFNSFLCPKPGLLTLSSVYVSVHKHRKQCLHTAPCFSCLMIVLMKSSYLLRDGKVSLCSPQQIKYLVCAAWVLPAVTTCMFVSLYSFTSTSAIKGPLGEKKITIKIISFFLCICVQTLYKRWTVIPYWFMTAVLKFRCSYHHLSFHI